MADERNRWYRYWAAPSPTPPPTAPAESVAVQGEAFHVEHRVEAETFHVERRDDAASTTFHVEHQPADAADTLVTRFAPGRIVVVANQKGGVGKTTTAVSLAAALAEAGSRVLLVDLDPQGNASSGVGLRVQPGRQTIYDVLVRDVELDDVVEPTSVRNLFLIPANLDLAGAEIELVSAFSREHKLRLALEPAREDYDVILVDCPPSLGLLTVNALTAADGVLVPIQCEYYALEGLGALQRNADLVRRNLNPQMQVAGYVMTMLDSRTRLGQQVVDEVRAHFGDLVFDTTIPRSVRLAEAPSFGQPIGVFDPYSKGARAYRKLARELLRRLAATAPALVEGGAR